jgi:hypothetical protein
LIVIRLRFVPSGEVKRVFDHFGRVRSNWLDDCRDNPGVFHSILDVGGLIAYRLEERDYETEAVDI